MSASARDRTGRGRGWTGRRPAGYTWRLPVTLDRLYFYTDDEFVMSDKVDMPDVFDYVVSGGYAKNGLMAVATFSQQRTTGGGDIRRQDTPFVSNRMNSTFSGAGAQVLSYLFPGDAAYFEAQKDEASISRLYGGIHYRSDLEVGKDHGKRIGWYTVRFAMTDGADAR